MAAAVVSCADMSALLPPPEEQDALIDAIAELCRAHGFEGFLFDPVVLPAPQFFPDEYQPSEEGAALIARRLLEYAGLAHLEPVVELVSTEGPVEHEATVGGIRTSWSSGAGAYFGDFEDGKPVFNVNPSRLDDPLALTGALARVAAEVYRAHHQMWMDGDDELEEQLIDVTSVFLNFGVLTTNAAYLFRRSATFDGHFGTTNTRVTQESALSPAAMAFLVGAQLAVRGADRTIAAKILGDLEPKQRDGAKAALAQLEKRPEALRDRLGIPPPRMWTRAPIWVPVPASIRPAQRISPASGPMNAAATPPVEVVTPVFRVRGTRRWPLTLIGLAAGVVAAAVMGDPWMIAAGVVFGFTSGSLSQTFTCSGTGCERSLTRTARACPRCDGTVVGEIANLKEKFDAEARWRREHAPLTGSDEDDEALAQEALAAQRDGEAA